RRLRHLAAAGDNDADAAGCTAVIHGHQVDDVVLQAGADYCFDDLVAERVHPAVAAIGCCQRGERERELQVRVLRLCSGRRVDQILDLRLGLAAFDVEVNADQVRAGVASDERVHASRRAAAESPGLTTGRDNVIEVGVLELRNVLGSPGGTRDTTPGLAAAGSGSERERDRGQLRDVLRHQAAGAHHRQVNPFHGRLHLVGVPVHVDGDVLVRAEEQAAYGARAATAPAAATTTTTTAA